MFRDLIIKRVLVALAAAGLLAAAQVGVAAAASAAPYPPKAETSTQLTLQKYTVNPGEKNTATARVSSGAGTPQGTVTFQVAGQSGTVALNGSGKASWAMPTNLDPGKSYQVTATYNGNAVYKSSSDSAYVTVNSSRHGQVNGNNGQGGSGGAAGGSGANGNGGGKSRPGAVLGIQDTTTNGSSSASGLPATGSDANTMLYGVGGLVLVGAGGTVLVMRRRRNHA